RLKSVKAILTIKLTAYHRPISICFVGKKLFLIFNKMFTISPWAIKHANSYLCIGYGFNDEHIQPKLVAKCLRQKTPITIITYALSAAARKLIINGNAQNYLAIERGETDNQSIVYSSLSKSPVVVDQNIWSFEGYMSLIM
ncbi:hypothetical protein, partial [Aeromonas media]|uniref:hypothetical protein n=1 Tax=Aeromonas media TaxID=651 RepID=UPI0038D06E7C